MHWQVASTISGTSSSERFDQIIKTLLVQRGFKTPSQIADFKNPPLPEKIPFSAVKLDARAIRKAVSRLKKAIADRQPIFVYGDYDADGITATAILWETLYRLGANVLPFIPHREKHGYGLKKEGIEEILTHYLPPAANQPLIVTVDNGIVAFKAVNYARQKGIEVIITDHHQPSGRLPQALSIVHTTQLSGAGVAWFFSRALLDGRYPRLLSSLLELAAIGTIADMMPLVGANRSLAKFGLQALRRTQRVGLKAILKEAGLAPETLDTYHINFVIAPRLNAMGRLEDALDSLRLLCTPNPQRAAQLAKKLGETNRQRQALTQKTLDHARGLHRPRKKLIFVAHPSYHQGIIGLVAGKLVEEHHRPAIVVTKGEVFSKGSARSIKAFDIIKALRRFKPLFVDLGGHPMAAGFTIETKNLARFQEEITQLAEKTLSEKDLTPTLKIDCQIELTDVTSQLYRAIQQFAPFGLGNPRPVFCSRGVRLAYAKAVGNDFQHLKLQFYVKPSGPTRLIDAIAFGFGHLIDQLHLDQPLDIAYTIDENTFNSHTTLQLKIKDLKT